MPISHLLISAVVLHLAIAMPTAATTKLQVRDGSKVSGSLATYNYANVEDGICAGSDKYIMFDNYKATMFTSCSQWSVPKNSGEEVGDIWNAIQQVSGETGVDHRFILAIVMQESGGCVRVPGTDNGVRNPGLLQDHDGAATCNENGVTTPCSQETITQMIRVGVAGTAAGDGLAQCINNAIEQFHDEDAKAYYRAARNYNSGSVADSGTLEEGIATHRYASDIANRLTGWVNPDHGCSETQ
ncbi:muramidase like protein [Zymoseptoria brevis]|uniref:Muramidase like protein n=1 Tax=Zymoseptoria brevis TaxID=1047168 RepID=A0A0F4G6N4_9PEZI|nr:muramidase like protein [Zymoseptoria brevis]